MNDPQNFNLTWIHKLKDPMWSDREAAYSGQQIALPFSNERVGFDCIDRVKDTLVEDRFLGFTPMFRRICKDRFKVMPR